MILTNYSIQAGEINTNLELVGKFGSAVPVISGYLTIKKHWEQIPCHLPNDRVSVDLCVEATR